MVGGMRVLVTGSEGFIGSHFCDLLESEGVKVERFDKALGDGDDLDYSFPAAWEFDWVAHFAALAEVTNDRQHGDALKHLQRIFDAEPNRILFASSSAALKPTSYYGASKAACEAFLKAWAAQGNTALVGRWDLCLGSHYARGHVADFVQRLTDDQQTLTLKGDGLRTAVEVHDLVRELWRLMHLVKPGYTERNIGHPETFRISESAGWIAERMGLRPLIVAPDKIERLRMPDWTSCPPPMCPPREAVERTVDYLCASR